jgi:ABC-type nitrate/sulfonate/bicarbonate transport system permease component
MARVFRKHPEVLLRIGVILAAAAVWELIAHFVVTTIGTSKDPNFPSIEYMASKSLLRMSDYWGGGLGAPSPQEGGKETYRGALLALGSASLITFERMVLGVGLGIAVGSGAGLLTSASSVARHILRPPMHVLRMVPFLALAPLFDVWFGKTMLGAVLFIAYGVGIVMFTGTINAVELTPKVFLQRAATNGASRGRVYREVIIPFIVPAMRATILVSIGLAWTLDVAAELLGAQHGLGVILQDALRFAYTGRVILVGFLFVLYAALTYYAVQALTAHAVRWHAAVGARSR